MVIVGLRAAIDWQSHGNRPSLAKIPFQLPAGSGLTALILFMRLQFAARFLWGGNGSSPMISDYGRDHRGRVKKSCRAGEKLRWALNFSSGPAVAENTTPGGECSVAGTIIKERKEVLNAFHMPVHRPSGLRPPPADDIGTRITPPSLVASAVPGPAILRPADNRIKHPHCRLSRSGRHTPGRACA